MRYMCIYEIYHIHNMISFAGPWLQLEAIILDDGRHIKTNIVHSLFVDVYGDTHNHKYNYDTKAE